jgi:hypothetical protein
LSIADADTTEVPQFSGIRAILGRCVLEHGDTAAVVVGVDSAGIIYLLDSPTGFRFLLRRHPVAQVAADSLVEYAALALTFTGNLAPGSRVVYDAGDLPPAVLEASGVSREEVTLSGVQKFPHGADVVWVSAITRGVLRTFGVVVDRKSGDIVVLSHPRE